MRSSLLVLVCLFAMRGGAEDYKQALPGYQYEFPRDQFNHPDYRTEWWYYTGNVKAADGRRFGFELTFFRQAVARDANESPWRVNDLYMAHLALSDINGRRFYHDERINRAGPGIAGIDERTGLVWNGNWQVQIAPTRQTMRALNQQFAIQLNLTSAKPAVIQGRDGVSRKAAGVGHASHYISLTRLLASGNIDLDGRSIHVEGTAWMDHEFFSDSMDATESGWDWMSLQLDDRSEVMLYRLRHRDGSVDPYSSASYVDAQGNYTYLTLRDFSMTPVGETWTSMETKGVYPVHWHIAIPRLDLDADITTPLPNQEIPSRFGPSYWEGAIDVNGKRAGGEVRGVGYLEMTGYAEAMHE
ncbi:MAG TPA: lipocalin-like domain-containing protein [Terracidiphilus sp.]